MTRSGLPRITMLTRFPRPGEVKTRIAEVLGDEAALSLHDRMARHTLRRALALKAAGEATVEVRTDASFQGAAREWLGRGPVYRYQGEGDLGARLRSALNDGFRARAERVVVVGSDCPRLTTAHLRQALHALESRDMVLGPALDGGYYLVGLTRAAAMSTRPRLFADIPWGTSEVLPRTLELVEQAGLTYSLLEKLPDVDRPEDVPDAQEALGRASVTLESRVSVVIPALNEESLVAAAVTSARGAGADEVLVVDGGSGDGTRDAARAAGARVLDAPAGRATQMNAGALAAGGEILLFLHADTTLPPGCAPSVRESLGRDEVVAGGFRFSVGDATVRQRIISAAGRLRARIGRLPYGDEGLFLSAMTFRDLGGFPDLPVMEDYEFARRLRSLGEVVVLPEAVVTSPRAWDERGLLMPTVINAAVIVAYRLGLSPKRLAGWRKRISPR